MTCVTVLCEIQIDFDHILVHKSFFVSVNMSILTLCVSLVRPLVTISIIQTPVYLVADGSGASSFDVPATYNFYST